MAAQDLRIDAADAHCTAQVANCAVSREMLDAAGEREEAARKALELKQERLAKLRAEPSLRRLAERLLELRARIDDLRQVLLLLCCQHCKEGKWGWQAAGAPIIKLWQVSPQL